LLRYSNKIQSVGLSKCPFYHYITKTPFTRYNRFLNRFDNRFDNMLYRVNGAYESDVSRNNKHFAKLAPQHGEKTAGIDVV